MKRLLKECQYCDGGGVRTIGAGLSCCWECGGVGKVISMAGEELVEFLYLGYGLVPLRWIQAPKAYCDFIEDKNFQMQSPLYQSMSHLLPYQAPNDHESSPQKD